MKNDYEMYQSVLSKRNEHRVKKERQKRIIIRTVPVLACLVLTVGLGLGYWNYSKNIPNIPSTPVIIEEVTTTSSVITTSVSISINSATTVSSTKTVRTTTAHTTEKSTTSVTETSTNAETTEANTTETIADPVTETQTQQTDVIETTVTTKFLVDKAVNNYNINNTTVHNQGKRGVVESVLYYKDKAQERQEQRIDNEIRRRQAISERRKERALQIINDTNKLRNFLILFFSILGIIVLTIVYFSAKTKINKAKEIKMHKGDIKLEQSYHYFIGQNYNDVELYLKDKGFSNIDLVETFALPKDGDVNAEDVKAVSINGNSSFSSEDWFSPDSTVRITYFREPQILTTTTVSTTAVTTTTSIILSENVERGIPETDVQEDTSVQVPEANIFDIKKAVENGDYSLVTPEFKATMDAYEAFYDDYIACMNRYTNASYGDDFAEFTNIMNEYFDMLEKLNEWSRKIDAIDESQLSPADDAYFLLVTLRIEQKLLGAIAY